MIRGQHGLSLLLGILLILLAGNAAAEFGNDRVRVSGFGTLALTFGGDEDLGFRRDMYREGLYNHEPSLFADSIAGLQVDARLTDSLDAALQLVGKDRADDNLEDSVEWAFLRYRLNPDWTVRAGRMGFDIYMLSEYRSLGFSYLWTRPPLEFYAPVAFDSFDGADITYSTPAGDGTLRAKLYAGKTKNNFVVLGNLLEVKLEPIYGASLSWESERWQVRLGVAPNRISDDHDVFPGTEPLVAGLEAVLPFWPEAQRYIDRLSIEEPYVYYYSAGIAFNDKPWVIQSEIAYVDSDLGMLPAMSNGYLSVGRQIGEVTLFGMLSAVRDQGDRDVLPPAPVYPFPGMEMLNLQLAAMQQGLQMLFDATHLSQTTLSTGLRWDLRYDMALKMQMDHTRVDAYGAGLWDREFTPGKERAINTVSLNLNYVF